MTPYEQIQQMLASRADSTVDLDTILITAQLWKRPSRAPDYKAENEALSTLARELSTDSERLLQTLCQLALELCHAHSAGISIAEEMAEIPIFRWRALAGEMTPYLLGMTPRDFAPCGVTVERNAPQLFTRPELYYPYVLAIEPLVSELLLIPFCLDNKPVGTLWVVSSKEDRQFDPEDVRVLTTLSQFAAAAYRATLTQEEMQKSNTQLAAEVTLHKTTVEELRASELEIARQARLFDTALSSIADYVFTCDTEGRIVYANRARLALWQRELKDVLGKTFLELGYPAELAAHIQAQIQTVVTTRQPLRAEAEYTGASGMAGYYDYILTPVFGQNGEVEAVAGSTRDITTGQREKTETEALLKMLEVERARLTSLFMQAPAFIAILRGPEHIFEMVNPPYLQLVGQRDLLDKPVREAFPEIEGQGFFELLDEVYRTKQPFIGKDMRISFQAEADAPLQDHYIDFVYQPLIEADGSVSGIFVHGIDLTERKRAEVTRQFLAEASALLASSLDYEQTLQQVADLAVPHIADWCGVDMREEDGSISQLAVAHVDPEKVKWGHELRKRYPPDPNAPQGLPNVLRTGRSEIFSHIPDELLIAGARDAEHLKLMRQIGLDSLMIVPMIARGRILGAISFVATDESGHHYTKADLDLAEGLAARAALAIDNSRLYRAAQKELTERRRVQEALHASEERFRFALANSSIIVYTQDRALRYTWVYNGMTNSEDMPVYGKTDADLLAAEEAIPLMEIKRRVLHTGVEERHIIRATPLGQETMYLDTSFAPLRDQAGNLIGITGTANNITERKKAQDALAQHQAEIEALNVRLQRSMRETHHRVKNNLQVITALVNMQQMQYEEQVPTSELQRLTQHIRALASIHDLLTHQAQADADVSDISVQDVMTKLMPTVQGMVEGRQISFAVEDIRLPVRQSTTFAVLVNELVSNALKHGTGEIRVGFSVEGDTAALQVLDEGPGFPPGFNPINAANTGLDLIGSLSRMDMRGSVRYENRAEGGARVIIEFPVPALLKTPGEE